MSNENKKPSWVKNLENWGKKEGKKPEKKGKPISEFVFDIVANLIIFYIVNNLLTWNVPYLTSEWTAVLWILNISIIYNLAVDIVMLLFYKGWLRAALKLIGNVISILVMLTFWFIYPLDFSSLSFGNTLDLIVRILIILGIVGTAIGAIVEFFKIFSRD
jgi:hypothetical protein